MTGSVVEVTPAQGRGVMDLVLVRPGGGATLLGLVD